MFAFKNKYITEEDCFRVCYFLILNIFVLSKELVLKNKTAIYGYVCSNLYPSSVHLFQEEIDVCTCFSSVQVSPCVQIYFILCTMYSFSAYCLLLPL